MSTQMHAVIALGLEHIPTVRPNALCSKTLADTVFLEQGWMKITDCTHKNYNQYCKIDIRKGFITVRCRRPLLVVRFSTACV